MRFRGPPGPMNKGGRVRTCLQKDGSAKRKAGKRIGVQSGRWPKAGGEKARASSDFALLRACRPVRGVASSTARSVTKVTAGALDMDYCSSVVIGAIPVSRDPGLQEGVVSCARP